MLIANPDGITPEQLEQAIRSRFCNLQVWPNIRHFQPENLGWPTAYFSDRDLNGDDLTVHEIDGISLISELAKYFGLISKSPNHARCTR